MAFHPWRKSGAYVQPAEQRFVQPSLSFMLESDIKKGRDSSSCDRRWLHPPLRSNRKWRPHHRHQFTEILGAPIGHQNATVNSTRIDSEGEGDEFAIQGLP